MQYVEGTQRCKQFLGGESEALLARVHADCEYFSGETWACVIENLACDFIVGKIPGANVQCTKMTQAVQTRAQAVKENRPFRPLLTTKVPRVDIDRDKLAELQMVDQSLVPVFQKVGKDADTDASGNVVSFLISDGLLFRRHFYQRSKVLTWQIVVPESLGESVLVAAHDSLFGGHMAANSTFSVSCHSSFGQATDRQWRIIVILVEFARKPVQRVVWLQRRWRKFLSLTLRFEGFPST